VLNLLERKEEIKIAVKKKIVEEKAEKLEYTCLCCGYKKSEDDFFISKYSKVWNESNKAVLFCKDCINKLFQEFTNRYKSEETALQICCSYLDVPFFTDLYRSIVEKNSFFNVGLYLRQVNMRQYQYKSFQNSILEGEFCKTESKIKEERESRWSKKDKRNMSYALSTVGYDPFEDLCMTDTDRKYSYNILAGYCDTDEINNDGHKMQGVIQLTTLHLQCKKMDESINQELLQLNPNDDKISKLTTAKKSLLDSIAKIAKDNNISSNYNKNSKQGRDSMSSKMKEMEENDFTDIKVSMFDIKTSEAFKQISDLSNRSIMDQLSLDSNDYTEIVKDQRELIQKFEQDIDELKEENRNLKNEIVDLKNVKR